MDDNPQQPKIKHRIRTVPLLIALIVLIISLTGGFIHFVVFKPHCLTLTGSHPKQLDDTSNDELIKLAQKLGATNPIKTCSGDISALLATDGYRAFAIRIVGANESKVKSLNCPVRPRTDNSNSLNVTYAHQAFRNRDTITNYYSQAIVRPSSGQP